MALSSAIQPQLTSVAGDQCPACGATLAADQRYCIECGERCGPPNYPAVATRAQAAGNAVSDRSRRFTPSSGTTLVAGVATLLLALGVGVLIGHQAKSGNQPVAAKQPVQVVTVAGGGPAASGATAAGAGAAAIAKPAKAHKLSAAKRKATAKKSQAAVNKVLHPTKAAGKLPPANVKLGSKGSGRGYKNGKFTGDFFGPGQ